MATFNLENFDETAGPNGPTLVDRIELMRPQIERLGADIACFQEVNGQERPGQPRSLLALQELLQGTNLDGANLVSTKVQGSDDVFDERNLVVGTSFPIVGSEQLSNKFVKAPKYQLLTAIPEAQGPMDIKVERPILHVTVQVGAVTLHLINVHLKSKLPTDIPGQKLDRFTWRTSEAWAEGSFISSMKRMSQALEVRRLIDQILDADQDAASWSRVTSTPRPTRCRCSESGDKLRTQGTRR